MPKELTPTALSKIRQGAALSGILPYVEAELNSMEEALRNRIFNHIQDGTLSPDAAVSGWMEWYGYQRLRRRFRQTVNIGTAVGAKNKEALD